jgi:hypothetical protein
VLILYHDIAGPRVLGKLDRLRGHVLQELSQGQTLDLYYRLFGYDPYYAAITTDGHVAVVGNLLPAGSSTDTDVAARVYLIDVPCQTVPREIALPYGSANVRGVAISPDDRWAYVAHARSCQFAHQPTGTGLGQHQCPDCPA